MTTAPGKKNNMTASHRNASDAFVNLPCEGWSKHNSQSLLPFISITKADWNTMNLYGDDPKEQICTDDETMRNENGLKGCLNWELVNNQPAGRQESRMEVCFDSELPVNQFDGYHSGMKADTSIDLPCDDLLEIDRCHIRKVFPDTKNRKKQGFWMENVDFSDDVQYRYVMKRTSVSDILKADLEWLNKRNQPSLVLDQLNIGQCFQNRSGYGNKTDFDVASFDNFNESLFKNQSK